MITKEVIDEFKARMRIYHKTEDDSIEQMLEASFFVLKNLCGEFDLNDREGKELVFERTRYVYHDSVEFFEQNFRSRIHSFGYTLSFQADEDSEVNDDNQIRTTTDNYW